MYYQSKAYTLYVFDVIDVMTIHEVYKELFLEEEYNWKPFEHVNSIVDLGAHYGDTALYYHELYPDAEITAVEALPENLARIKRAVRTTPQIKVVPGALGVTDDSVDFYLTPSTLGSSLINRDKARSSITVEQFSLPTLFKKATLQAPVDLIKFDIEGGEFEVFKHFNPAQYARAYVGEIHLDFVAGARMDTFLEAFKDFDCTLIEIVGSKGQRYMLRAVHKSVINHMNV